MKYNSTTRSLNTIIFGLLATACIVFAVFFTFIWGPKSIVSGYGPQGDFWETGKTFAYNLDVGTLLFALGFVNVIGLVYSIKSLGKPSDDTLVVKSFLSYICAGYVIAIFFALNAIWLYDLIGGEESTFWVVLCILGTIVAMIAANVPMMKLLQDDKTNALSTIVTTAFLSIAVGIFVNTLYPFIIAISSDNALGYWKSQFISILVFSFVAAGLIAIAVKFFMKNEKIALANYFTYGSLAAFAGIPLFSGIYELVYSEKSKVSFITKGAFAGKQYAVFAIITAGIILVGVAALVITTLVGDKKETK